MSVVKDPDKAKEERLCSLMERYEKDLLRMCCVYLRDASAAEDAVQESFLRAYRAMSDFRGESSEKTWLYSIATNVCRDMRRAAWYRYVDRRIDFDRLPQAVAPVSEVSVALMTEVMRLPRNYMEAVWLYYYEDLNLSEVGALLGVTPAAVGYRLSKAKKLLRSALKGDETT
ncbi:MAG: sigma-70 family RNA polymerase sigma factor [Candidatus Ventricola sp.]